MSDTPIHELYEANPDAIVVISQAGRIDFANSRIKALLGYLPRELLGKALSILIPERYRALHSSYTEQFMNDPSSRMMGAGMELVALRKDGSECQVEISLSPYLGSEGSIVIAALREVTTRKLKQSVLEREVTDLRVLLGQARSGVARLLAQAEIDATKNEAAKRLQRLVLEEVHHRMKNMLATTMAMASQSLRSAKNLEQGELALANRLTAMGRAQDLLLQTNEANAQLAGVIRAAIEPFDNRQHRQIIVQDAMIEIGPSAILPLTLTLNELCTNAVKYGALSNTTGCVNITLTVDEKTQMFTLKWTESGGPAVQAPSRRGFGSRLLVALAAQLHGEARLKYEPTGIVYELNIPAALLSIQRAN